MFESTTVLIIGGLLVAGFILWYFLDEEDDITVEKRLLLENFKASMQRSRERVRKTIVEKNKVERAPSVFERFGHRIKAMLVRANIAMSVARFIALFVFLSFLGGFIISMWFSFPFWLALIMAFGGLIGLLFVYFRLRARRRMKAFIAQFPDALDSISRGVRSGLPISRQIENLAHEFSEPLAGVFLSVSDHMSLGNSLAEALRKVSSEFDSQEFRLFSIAISIQQKTGGRLSEVLDNIAKTIRSRLDSRARLEALVGQAKSGAYIIGSAPLGITAFLGLLQPAHFDPLFTPEGNFLLWLILGLYFMAFLSFKYLLRDRF